MGDNSTYDKKSRTVYDIEPITKGLFVVENNELLPSECLLEVDGFIVYTGLLRKDWALVKCTDEIMGNVNCYVDTSLPVCLGTPERGTPVEWPTVPDIPEGTSDLPTLEWFSYFSGVSEITDYTCVGGSVFKAEVFNNDGPVTFTIEEI